jgi:serine phosphatase RsbU (regulator of sigma subunit)
VFATLVTFDLDPTTGAFRYCVAGHPHPILLRKGRASFLDGAQCLPLGVGPDAAYTEAALTLDAGDVILLYTDGVVERRDERLDDRLELLLRTVEAGAGLHPEALADHVVRELVPEPARADDVALLALELLGAAAPIDHTAPPDPVVLGDVQQELRG